MWNDLREIYYEISADIEHGECFYDEEMFQSFIKTVDRLKGVAIKYYEENQSQEDSK